MWVKILDAKAVAMFLISPSMAYARMGAPPILRGQRLINTTSALYHQLFIGLPATLNGGMLAGMAGGSLLKLCLPAHYPVCACLCTS